jgi:hypothetical protein
LLSLLFGVASVSSRAALALALSPLLRISVSRFTLATAAAAGRLVV